MRVSVRRWEIDVLLEETRRAYAARGQGGPEACGCLHCRNFAAARSFAYPAEALAILTFLGVDSSCEAEVWHYGEVSPGVHLYGGCFHLAGRLHAGADASRQATQSSWIMDLAPVTESFRLGVSTKLTLVPKSFKGLPLVQLDFQAHVPWLLAEPFSPGKRPG